VKDFTFFAIVVVIVIVLGTVHVVVFIDQGPSFSASSTRWHTYYGMYNLMMDWVMMIVAVIIQR